MLSKATESIHEIDHKFLWISARISITVQQLAAQRNHSFILLFIINSKLGWLRDFSNVQGGVVRSFS